MNLWPQIVLGWPFVALAWIFLILSLVTREVWAAAVGAFFSAGFCVYLWTMTGWPFFWWGPIALLGTLSAIVAIDFRRVPLALLADLPYFLASGYVLVAVVRLRL